MKYCVENRLDLFEFEDCEFSFVSFDEKDLAVSVKRLNIHKNAKENPYDRDMEIALANIYFGDIQIHSVDYTKIYEMDGEGNGCIAEAPTICQDDEAKALFTRMLKSGFSVNRIFDVGRSDDRIRFQMSANAQGLLLATISCSGVTVAWDSYVKTAWYVSREQYGYEITLMTPDGEQKAPLRVTYDTEDLYHTNVTVEMKYQDRDIEGRGKDYPWVDAFADLQKQLPDGVILKCCLTCRHGNMCPYGNAADEVFCTKGIKVTSKNDLCDWFDDAKNRAEVESRSRRYADTCQNYKHQSFDFYTYNDYLYELVRWS